MTPYAISPIYFPTTVAIVDDSASFLNNLALHLPPLMAFRMSRQPMFALADLNDNMPDSSLRDRVFSLYRYRGDTSYAHHVINVSLDMIHREIYNEHRFDQVSVVVVDYDMPEMDGLQFCRGINNPTIKKILLTGKADESIAVHAFNQRIIDRFIRKQDTDIVAQLAKSIAELQVEHFAQIAGSLTDALSMGSHMFLRDVEFHQCFAKICKEFGCVEHYITCTPEGILMIDAEGNSLLMVIQTDEMMKAQCEIAYDQSAPDELLSQIRAGQSIPYFWKTDGNYEPAAYPDWQSFMHPAKVFQGSKDRYLYALIKNPGQIDMRHVRCYAEHLRHLDEVTPQVLPPA